MERDKMNDTLNQVSQKLRRLVVMVLNLAKDGGLASPCERLSMSGSNINDNLLALGEGAFRKKLR